MGVLGFLLPAALFQLYDEKRMDEVKNHLRYSLKYILAFAIPIVFVSAILAEPLLTIFSTAEIASQARFIMPIVALSMLVFGCGGVISHIIFLVKKTKIIGAA